MEKVKGDELLKEFKDLENKLVEALKIEPIEISDEKSDIETKIAISAYIKKIKKVKKLFEKYESVARQIEKLSGDTKKQEEFTQAVVERREEEQGDNVNNQDTEEITLNDKKVIVKKNKKRQSNSIRSREF